MSFGGSPKPPKPPDYVGAAREQGIQNLEAARATGRMSNPNVTTPYGTQTVTWNGDQANVTQAFSPEQQALYDKNVQTQGLLGDLGISGASKLGEVIGKNVDMSGITAQPGDYGDTRQKVIDSLMQRYNTDSAQREEQVNSDLIARGIHPGTEAYTREMQRIDQARNDYRAQAENQAGSEVARAYSTDADLRNKQIAEMLMQRQTPLNEITALQSGSQVSNPFAQAPAFQGGATVNPAPLFQATQAQGQAAIDRYNAQAANSGNLMSGLFGLGGSLGSAYLLGSDRRLKKNVIRIGTHALGIPRYIWTYLWGEVGIGVMADELEQIMPEAVVVIGGYQHVNYAMIGGH